MNRHELDVDARYSVKGWPKVAVWIDEKRSDNDGRDEYGEPVALDGEWVYVVMVGDDYRHLVEASELVKITDDEYCPGCGQIGCGWGH